MLGGNCSPCCGDDGWYCCADGACLANPSSVSVSIVSADWYQQVTMEDTYFPNPYSQYQSSLLFLGGFMNGTYSLTKTSPPLLDGRAVSEWYSEIPHALPGCSPYDIRLSLSYRNIFRDDIVLKLHLLYARYSAPSGTKSPGELSSCLLQPTQRSFSSGYYAVWRRTWDYLAPFPACVDGTAYTHTFVDNPARFATHARDSDERYGSRLVSINSESGTPHISITLSVTA